MFSLSSASRKSAVPSSLSCEALACFLAEDSPVPGTDQAGLGKEAALPQTPGALISSTHTHQVLVVYFVETLFRAPELSKTRCNRGQLELYIT